MNQFWITVSWLNLATCDSSVMKAITLRAHTHTHTHHGNACENALTVAKDTFDEVKTEGYL